jgi:UDP-N-acetylmuramate dehydrogenase
MNSIALQSGQSGQVRENEPMSKHTSWRLGGPADIYYTPDSVDGLCRFLRELDTAVPVFWTGLGSNLLVRDGGIRGAVITPSRAMSKIDQRSATMVEAGAGVPCTQLGRQCARWQLGPADFFAGIPGTVGGALTMNAGAFGGETWDRVVEVDTVDRRGAVQTRTKSEFDIGYRQVSGPAGEWYIGARFELEQQTDGLDRVRKLMQERQLSQPLGLPSCGSVFRNPPARHAAQLIESAGLKGHRIGGAVVSDKHANFIINTGDATADDVEQLIQHIRDVVLDRHGISLEPEVHIVGEPA